MKKIIAFIAIGLFLVNYAFAVTKTYVGTSGGNWNTAGNWSPSGVPGTSDDITIPSAKTVVLDISPATVRSLNISGSLTMATNQTLNVTYFNLFSGGGITGGSGSTGIFSNGGTYQIYKGNGSGGYGTDPMSGPAFCATSCSATGGPLSVSLLSFKAILNNDQSVLLNWETVSETDSRYYLLNRGNNLDALHEITRVEAAGQSTTRKLYSFTDANPPLGTNYYQLSEVDNNGIVQAFRPVSIVVENPNTPFGIFPNPSGNQSFRVKVESAENAVLSLITAGGQSVSFNTTKESETVVIVQPNENLASGVYLLNIKNSGTERTHKVVIE